MEDLLKVGVITTTHGVRGEVKVYPTTDPERFPELDYVLLDTGREKRKLEHKQFYSFLFHRLEQKRATQIVCNGTYREHKKNRKQDRLPYRLYLRQNLKPENKEYQYPKRNDNKLIVFNQIYFHGCKVSILINNYIPIRQRQTCHSSKRFQ